MKLHVDLAVKVGKFELEFRSFELKMKLAHDLVAINIKPRKIGFVIVNNKLVFHFAVACLAAHVGFFYHKDAADVIVPSVEKVAAEVEEEVVKVVDDIKAVV